MRNINLEKFIEKSSIKHNNFYTYTKSIYVNNYTTLIITCPIHGDFYQLALHHIKGVGCSKCSNNYNRTNEEFISESINKHNAKYKYDKTYFINNKTKVIITCPTHGDFIQSPYHHLKGFGCKKCTDSRGELYINNFLSKKEILFIRNKTFDDCIYKAKLKYDFYLPDFNICIEYDGVQHYKPIDIFGGVEGLNDTKIRDNIKDKYCLNNNIILFRIKYSDNLESSLYEILKIINDKL